MLQNNENLFDRTLDADTVIEILEFFLKSITAMGSLVSGVLANLCMQFLRKWESVVHQLTQKPGRDRWMISFVS